MNHSFCSCKDHCSINNSIRYHSRSRSRSPNKIHSQVEMEIEEFDDYEKKIDPRIRSFMTEVEKEISQKTYEEKQALEQSQRRIEVGVELEKIRKLDKRIETQNKLASMTMDKLNKDLDNTPQNTVKFKTETNFFRNEQIEETKMNKINTESFPNSCNMFEGESDNNNQSIKQNQNNLNNSDVDTLITRIHEYYERLHEDDQEQFFDSSKYIDAGKKESIGRDLNISRHHYVYSPKYDPFQKK